MLTLLSFRRWLDIVNRMRTNSTNSLLIGCMQLTTSTWTTTTKPVHVFSTEHFTANYEAP